MKEAVKEYRRLCKSIDCDFDTKDNAVYSLNDKNKIQKRVISLKSIGFQCRIQCRDSLPFKTAGAVIFKNQAQFNPLKF